MYVWLWRHLPGSTVLKLLGCVVLFTGVTALLFLVVFPWIDPRLPWNHVAVGGGDAIRSLLGSGRP